MPATVIALGSVDLINKGKALMAHLEDVPLDAVTFEDGFFRVAASNRALSWYELAPLAEQDGLPVELQGGLRVRRDNEMHTPVFPNGACMCEIEIDPETGSLDIKRYTTVDDVGRCINPLDRARPDPWRHRAGRRPGAVGAMRHRSRPRASR